MRILRLDLTAFGCFSGVTLDLSAGAEDQHELERTGRYGLHVLYGPNEAGKSTSLRALVSLLYGIDQKTPDNFLHAYDQMRIGGRLESDSGVPLECIRRKGNKRTLRGLDDNTEVDDVILKRMLGSIDRATFEAQFGLNDQRLRAGGLQILEGKGEVGEILFAAGAGLERLAAVRRQLAADAEGLFLPRASKPVINKCLTELAAARKARAAVQLTANHYEERATELGERERKLAAAKTRAGQLSAEARDLARRRDALPLVAQRERLARELAALPATPDLRAEFADDLRRVEKEQAAALQACSQQEKTSADLRAGLAGLSFDGPLVAAGDTVRQLYRGAEKYRGTVEDRGSREVELVQLEEQAAQILADLDLADLGSEAALALRPAQAERVRLTELGDQRQVLAERRQTAAARAAELAEQLAHAREALAASPEPAETGLLQTAVEEARKEGDIEQRVTGEERAVAKLAEDLARRLRGLPGFDGSLAELAAMRVPSAATVTKHQKAIEKAEQAVDKAASEAAVRAEHAEEQRRELAELIAGLRAPTRDDLDTAREQREAGWQLVRERLDGGENEETSGQYVARFPDSVGDLPRAYELAVGEADHVADELWHSADAIGRQDQKREACATAEARQAKAGEALAAAQAELAERQSAWEAVWSGTGVLADSPAEMQDWLARRDELLAAEEGLTERRAAVEQQQTRVAELKQELRERLEEAGAPELEAAGALRLPRLVLLAQQRQDSLAAARREREKLESDMASFERQLPAARREAERADAAWNHWQSQWTEATRKLRLMPETTGTGVAAVLGELDSLANVSRDRKDKQNRTAQMQTVIDDFERDAAQIVGRFAPDLAALPPHLAAAQLHDRLRSAEAAKTKHDSDATKLAASEEGLRAARAALAAAEGELAALCQEAGGVAAEELNTVHNRWRTRTQLAKELSGVEEHLARLASPQPTEEFLAAAGQWDAARIAARLEEIEGESRSAADERDELTKLVAVEERELARFDRREDAARAAEDEQSLLAALRQESLRYARAQVAAGVLERAIDRYRQRNEGPILAEASRLVARLTRGSLTRLIADYDEDKVVLVGVRPDGSRVRHDAMSDGTRDQLYLALRLASLKQYLASVPEKLPLIVDDILVHFDDERSAAALEVLAELSHQTQVIFFTHHAHLVELAEKHVPASDLFLERLESRLPTPIGT